MADGFQLPIDAELADRIERAASQAGVARDAYARQLLAQQLFDIDSYAWNGDDPRTTTTEPPSAEDELIDWEEAEPRFRAVLGERLASKG